jgi:hypothetical protein
LLPRILDIKSRPIVFDKVVIASPKASQQKSLSEITTGPLDLNSMWGLHGFLQVI